MLGRGEHVVRVQARGAQARIDRHDHLQLRPDVFEQQRLTAALAPQQVAAGLHQHAGLDVLPQSREASLPPTLVGGLLEIGAEASGHRRVVIVGIVPALLVAVLVIPEIDGRDGAAHAAEFAGHFGRAVLQHLGAEGRIAGAEHAAHARQVGDEALRGFLAGFSLLCQEGLPVEADHGPRAHACSFLAPVPGERQQQRHRALHQIAVIGLSRVAADEDLGLARRHLARERADVVGVDLADRAGLLRRVVVELAPQAREDGLHLDGASIGEQHAVDALERRVDAGRGQRAARSGCEHVRPRVPPEELVVAVPHGDFAAAQKPAGVGAHQQRQIGLLLHEELLMEPRVDDHLAHRERERGVGADADRLVIVGVDCGGREVGRDGDDLAAVVPRLGEVVVHRDVGVDGVRMPDQGQLGEEPVVHRRDRIEDAPGQVEAGAEVVELGAAVGDHGAQRVREDARRRRPHLGRHRDDDRLRPLLLDGVEHRVGDLGERHVPRDRLELALAALAHAPERPRDAIGSVEQLRPARALLATHRVHVGDARLDLRQRAGLLLARDLAVLHVGVKRAAGGVAVDVVAAPRDAVPLPLASIRLGPVSAYSCHRLCSAANGS